jgi:hypothetical protein
LSPPWNFRFPAYQAAQSYKVWFSAPSQHQALEDLGLPQSKLAPAEFTALTQLPDNQRDLFQGYINALQLSNQTSLSDIILKVKTDLQQKNFRYSLSIPRTENFSDFLKNKQGWCSHYASFLALVLRALNRPTRLISGYLGGDIHPSGEFIQVSESDAHVWVETWEKGIWKNVDPTIWILPSRAHQSLAQSLQKERFGSFKIPAFLKLKQQFDLWNFKFLTHTEQIDRQWQIELAKFFGLNWFQWIAFFPGLILLVWIFSWLREKYQQLWANKNLKMSHQSIFALKRIQLKKKLNIYFKTHFKDHETLEEWSLKIKADATNSLSVKNECLQLIEDLNFQIYKNIP